MTETAATDGWARMQGWTDALPDQILEAWAAAEASAWPPGPFAPSGILLGGMGGSAMAGHLAASLERDRLRIPCTVHSDPALPAWVGPGALALISSYSGDTWEAVEMLRAAGRSGARPLAVTSGGRLRAEAAALGAGCFDLPGGYSPRAALGWLLVPVLLALLPPGPEARAACGEALRRAAALLREEVEAWNAGRAFAGRDPRELAGAARDRLALIAAPSEARLAVALRWRNQILENAEQAAAAVGFPEAAHHEIMGWRSLVQSSRVVFFFLEGAEAGPPLRERAYAAAQDEAERCGATVRRVPGRGATPLERMLSDVLLGDRVSVELSRLRGVDPVPVAAIARLKQACGKEPSG